MDAGPAPRHEGKAERLHSYQLASHELESCGPMRPVGPMPRSFAAHKFLGEGAWGVRTRRS